MATNGGVKCGDVVIKVESESATAFSVTFPHWSRTESPEVRVFLHELFVQFDKMDVQLRPF